MGVKDRTEPPQDGEGHGGSDRSMRLEDRQLATDRIDTCSLDRVTPRARTLRIFRNGETVDVALKPQRVYSFGRNDQADICLRHPKVSRLHGTLKCTDRGWTYTDLGSSNGSFVFSLVDYHALLTANADLPIRRLRPHESVVVPPGEGVALGATEMAFALIEELPEGTFDRSVSAGTCVSLAAQMLEENLTMAASSQLPVFLLGPSGVGKGFAAHEIHERSRLAGAFVPVNCAGLPDDPSMLRSELLGHVKGAVPGAEAERIGKLRLADRGTLFLDDVESMPPLAQALLFDLLGEKREPVAPLGAQPDESVPAPRFRLISASKVPLMQSALRRDLCGRLEGIAIRVPGLEERREDIPGLIGHFLEKLRREWELDARFNEGAEHLLAQADWPLQVRQLERTVSVITQHARFRAEQAGQTGRVVVTESDVERFLNDRAAVLGTSIVSNGLIDQPTSVFTENRVLRRTEPAPPPKDPRLLTAADLKDALVACGGSKSEAAAYLGIARDTLLKKLRELGLEA